MDPLANPQSSAVRGRSAALPVVVIVVAMVAFAIGGSAFFRPPPVSTATLELGGATPVDLATGGAAGMMARVLDEVAPTVAYITLPEEGRSGSGVVVHEDGFVVTNAHVVDGATSVHVTFSDGSEFEAEVWGVDTATDLAVVKITTDRPLRAAALGNSDQLQVGEFVLAIGAPFGLQATATSGIVSGLHRRGLGIARYEDFVVTDAPINRGNSGGPLVNLRGEVIGITTAIIAGEDGTSNAGIFAGVGFAIPVNVMRVIAERLIGDGGAVATPAVEASEGESTAVDGLRDGGLVTLQTSPAPESVVKLRALGFKGEELRVGSGFVIDSSSGRQVLTNWHVVRDARAVQIISAAYEDCSPTVGVVLLDRAGADLAIVSLPRSAPLLSVPLGGAGALRVGDEVVALGARRRADSRVGVARNPGVVLALDVGDLPVARMAGLIETSAAIEKGDSGAPLLDAAGSVVGVLVARDRADEVPAAGRSSYAIPVAHAIALIDAIESILVRVVDLGFDPGVDSRGGIIVTNVVGGGLAEQVGLQDIDVIVAIDGQPLSDSAASNWWSERLATAAPETSFTLTVERTNAAGVATRHDLVLTVPREPERP